MSLYLAAKQARDLLQLSSPVQKEALQSESKETKVSQV